MPNRYAVVDSATNLVTNVCVWDGGTPWDPPSGSYVVQSDTLEIGVLVQ